MHDTHVVCGGGDAGAGSSAGGLPCTEAANVDDGDVGAAEAQFDGPVPSAVHAFVCENVLDATMAPGASETIVKEGVLDAEHAGGVNGRGVQGIGDVACPSAKAAEDANVEVVEPKNASAPNNVEEEVVEPKNASAPNTHEEEGSTTELIESDGGFYDAPVTQLCGASEETEILGSSNSSAHCSRDSAAQGM
jgi:hypothetical protein